MPAVRPERQNDALENEFSLMQEAVRRIRDLRNKYTVPHQNRLDAAIKATGEAVALQHMTYHIREMSGLPRSQSMQPPKSRNLQLSLFWVKWKFMWTACSTLKRNWSDSKSKKKIW
ncbi:MAG: hypothetical protein R3C26_04300 [Calditrichia bacterium]